MSDIPSWAVRGSKVICVERDDWEMTRRVVKDPEGLVTFPVFGETYTIREVRVRWVTEYNALLIGVLLEEIANPIADAGSATGEEMAWHIDGFQPVRRAKQRAEIRVSEPA
jgi:hypothetical protein